MITIELSGTTYYVESPYFFDFEDVKQELKELGINKHVKTSEYGFNFESKELDEITKRNLYDALCNCTLFGF